MASASPPRARLLLIENNRALLGTLLALVVDEGYVAHGGSSLEEALAEVEGQSYTLILADLASGVSKHAFTPAQILRRRARSTPVGLITTHHRVLEQPEQAGFAFALPMPIEADLLLTEIAACLNEPLSPHQHRQAQLVERFLAAWGTQEWRSLLRLCTEEMVAYPSSLLPTAGGVVQGKLAVLHLVTAFRRHYHSLRLEAEGVYARPTGLAVRYRGYAAPFGQGWDFFRGAALFAFAGERMCQIGIPLSEQQWRDLRGFPPLPLSDDRSSS